MTTRATGTVPSVPDFHTHRSTTTPPTDRRPGFRDTFSALQVRNFRLLVSGLLVSATGGWIQRIAQEPVSLETPVGQEDDSQLGDFIEDQQAVAPAEAAARAMLTEAVLEALEQLTERERKIVRLRFGLEDGQVRTLEEVGKEFGVTRERIRQIEAKTLAKLRHPMRSQKLRDYLDEE